MNDGTYDDLIGQEINRVTRKGKYQLFHLTHGILLTHNKFTGLWDVKSKPWTYHYVEHERQADNVKDIRITFILENGEQLRFHDARALGVVEFFYTDNPLDLDRLRRQGPDVLITDTLHESFEALTWNLADLVDDAKKTSRDIKTLLLDQSKQSGAGNIYVCEAMWEARIDPRTPSKFLTKDQLNSLMVAIRTRMTESINNEIDYVKTLKVFKVRNKPMLCSRCSNSVDRMVQANRGTYWCSTCQTQGREHVKVHLASLIKDIPPPQNDADLFVLNLDESIKVA